MTRAAMITGSARRTGNTEILCAAFLKAFEDNGIRADMIRPSGMKISHCMNCGGCRDTKKCVVNDDMRHIYCAISESDIVILATPVHFSGMSSILKQVIDRLQCLWGTETEKKKALALICHGGSGDPSFGGIVSISKAAANTIGAAWAGSFAVKDTDSGISEEDLRGAYRFGGSVARFRVP